MRKVSEIKIKRRSTVKFGAAIIIFVVVLVALSSTGSFLSGHALETGNALEYAEKRDSTPQVPESRTGGIYYLEGGGVTLDYTYADDAYLMAKNESGKISKIIMDHEESGEQFIYAFNIDGDWHILPLQRPGRWHAQLYTQVEGIQYRSENSMYISAQYEDAFLPFLRPSLICPYNVDSLCVNKGCELSEKVSTDAELIDEVLIYFLREEYTHEITEQRIEATMYADYHSPDTTLITKKGMCGDFASLSASMLRSQGVPTKIIYGWLQDTYHAWICVFVEGQWRNYDPSMTIVNNSPYWIEKGSSPGRWLMEYYF
jgi:hypothetical protein